MNTNRLSTDIKHAKEALEKKLDSLQTGMDGIPNLLTQSFDSIKNVLSTITTKVDNVRGGVDLNHTTLTELQQRLTAVEGSVGQVQENTFSVAKNKPVTFFVDMVKPKEKKTVIDISGAGLLHYVRCSPNSSHAGATLSVELDGNKVELVHDLDSSGFLSIGTMEAFYTAGKYGYIQCCFLKKNNSGGFDYDSITLPNPPCLPVEELFSKPLIRLHGNFSSGSSNQVIGREKAYRFEKSMRVTVDFSSATTTTGYANNTECLYTLL